MSGNGADLSPTDPSALSEQWTDASVHAINSYIEANNAVLSAIGLSPSSKTKRERSEPPVIELTYGDATWTMERSSDEYDELGVGDYVKFSKLLTDRDVTAFAQVSGDTNRLHLEEAFAAETRFRGRIVHGTLVSGLISAALARLPGVTIYLSQDLEFNAPVRIGDRVTAECEIIEDLDDHRYRLSTAVYDEDDTPVIDGEAVVLIDAQPDV